MKNITILVFALFTSGCTTYSISNQSLLEPSIATKNTSSKVLKDFPLNIEASMSCYDRRVGNVIKTTCSNKSRINSVIKQFKERGINIVATDDSSDASISIEKDSLNSFLEGTTGFFNIITLGLTPLYHYDDYTVTFIDPKNNIDITKTVRISSSTSWFSLFLSNPENTENGGWKHRAEQNLIRSVLDEAKLGIITPQS